ncbi:MAG: CBS domain-containing protein [Nanoarchaeota archaeon]
MVFDITQLRKIRKQLDMTQHAFAKELGISQSMVAKIESEKLDPTYSYVKMIEDKIMHLTRKEEKEAKDIMNNKVIFVGKEDLVLDAIKLINSNGISQVPVVERGNAIGLVSESSILSGSIDEIGKKRVSEIMTESPPIIDKHAKLEVIIQLLKFYPILLVKEIGKLVGVITKADVIKCLK